MTKGAGSLAAGLEMVFKLIESRRDLQQKPIRPDAAWLALWCEDVDSALARLLPGFEDRFGYPPGENAVRRPGPDGLAAAQRLAAHMGVVAALPHFYRHVGEVVLADVGNAYFIHPASHVLRDLSDSGPIPLRGTDTGAFFASDGGGIHFAICTDGTVRRSITASRDSDFHPVAADLQDFLDQLRGAVIRFVNTGKPGDL